MAALLVDVRQPPQLRCGARHPHRLGRDDRSDVRPDHLAIRGAPRRDPSPAPVIYALVGNLKSAGGYTLAEALQNLANGLQASLKTHDVYDDGGDAAANADQAAAELKAAARLAEQIGRHLDAAQTAINRQGYRP